MYTTLFISAFSTTRFALFFWYSISHFLPSRVNVGGLLAAGAVTDFVPFATAVGAFALRSSPTPPVAEKSACGIIGGGGGRPPGGGGGGTDAPPVTGLSLPDHTRPVVWCCLMNCCSSVRDADGGGVEGSTVGKSLGSFSSSSTTLSSTLRTFVLEAVGFERMAALPTMQASLSMRLVSSNSRADTVRSRRSTIRSRRSIKLSSSRADDGLRSGSQSGWVGKTIIDD
uniref:Uncharacterized protein n=1 Tax=Anopheles atroparvus TaxID=41427 RepID=A0A182IS73_ANOAO